MEYFFKSFNPLRDTTYKKILKHVPRQFLTDEPVMYQNLVIDDKLRNDLNDDLKKYNLSVEEVLLFYILPNIPVEVHVDHFPNSTDYCHATLVLPWRSSTPCEVFWEQGNFIVDKTTVTGPDDVNQGRLNWVSDRTVCSKTFIDSPMLLRTDVPHGVKSVDAKFILVTLRFAGNPSIEDLQSKLTLNN